MNPNPKTLDLSIFEIQASSAEFTTWRDRQTLRLEDGLALAPAGLLAQDLCLEVSIGVEGPAYPGLVFRHVGAENSSLADFELAYAVPHASGLWDAIQYDPIFNNANTWQVYFGAPYQAAAQIPTGGWFRLRVQAVGQRAAISVNDQAPLVVERLAHPLRAGHFGLWTYRPAYYADLRVSPCTRLDAPSGTVPSAPPGAVEAWWLQGIGATACEPHGVLNLNRYLSASQSPASLERQFELPKPAEVLFEFGFSDSLLLELDGQELFRGERRFAGFGDRFDRGYAELGDHSVRQSLSAGQHTLRAQVNVSEPFGWGLALAAHAPGLRWLPLERTNTA